MGASPLLSALFHDEPTIEAMNQIGLDVNAVGNHEFDEGTDELLRLQEGGCHPVDGCLDGDGFAGADFEVLAANVVSQETGETLFPAYTVKRFPGNARVAFIGMTLEGTPTIVTPEGVAGFDFLDEAETASALVRRLERQGIENIIVLVHEGGVTTGGGYNGCEGVGPDRRHRRAARRPGRRRHQRPHPRGLQLRHRRHPGDERLVVRPAGHGHGPHDRPPHEADHVDRRRQPDRDRDVSRRPGSRR